MDAPSYDFLKQAGRAVNSGQTRTLLLTGAVHDLFYLPDEERGRYVPLIDLLARQWSVPGKIVVVYELNGPVRFPVESDREKVRDAWLAWRTGLDEDALDIRDMLTSGRARAAADALAQAFDDSLLSATAKPTAALELLRQLCVCSRSSLNGAPLLRENLVILIEAADMVIPMGEIPHMADADRRRISICQDWFSDPGFMEGDDAVALVTESSSLIHERVARLPQTVEIPVSSPNEADRLHFIEWFGRGCPPERAPEFEGSPEDLARATAGLSIHALNQLLCRARHGGGPLRRADVVERVERYIKNQVGEDVVEFKKPEHTLDDVVGFTALKGFLRSELMPRFRADGAEALPGAAVGGPIGSGKTFVFEAVAGELDMVVLVLKNIRSQWYGQTDVIFERLRRVLDALSKVLIFVDEADTQFGGVGPETHETERRLTGRIQAMMSDVRLRGRVVWLLMTARIHQLSPDIRRPGRVGDLIIPVLDPDGDDRDAFIRWTAEKSLDGDLDDDGLRALRNAMPDWSAAGYASLRSELRARCAMLDRSLALSEILEIASDRIPPAIGATRRYQTLQALVNCTRRSLLPDPDVSDAERDSWRSEIRELEAAGMR